MDIKLARRASTANRRGKIKRRAISVLLYAVALIFLLFVLVPIVWLVLSSFKQNHEIMSMSAWSLPKEWLFSNYAAAWERGSLGMFFGNSVLYTVCSVMLSVVLCSMVAYAVTRLRVRGGKFVLGYFLVGIMIPMNSLILPIYLLITQLNMLDSRMTLILIYTTFTMPISISLTCAAMRSIPYEMEEAAYIDGCGVIKNFIYIILPVCSNILATVAILNFLTCWNEFIFAMMLTSGDRLRTLSVGLTKFRGEHATDYSYTAAAMVIVMIPTIVVFILLQERIVKGITAGAVKG